MFLCEMIQDVIMNWILSKEERVVEEQVEG